MALRRGWVEGDGAGRGSEEDHALAVRARGDRAAFGILYDRYVDPVYGYCYRRLRSHAGAEDATSQTFLKALAALAGYREEVATFRAWLFTIAAHVVIDTYRAERPTTGLDDAAELRSTRAGPEELALLAERRRELHSLLARLPDDQLHLIQLRLAGLNDREIADVLGRSHGAVRIAQHRAIRQLRAMAAADALPPTDPTPYSIERSDR